MKQLTAAWLALLALTVCVAASAASGKAQQESLRMASSEDTNFHRKARGGPTATVDTLRKDAENQKAIMAGRGGKRRKGPAQAEAQSMTPHLEMHAARGEEAGRGRRAAKERNQKGKRQFQKTVYGKQALPPDEATPFFTTYVLHYAFPTIAIVCTCLGCILLRTMKMYQKERWKGTSYFHGARRSAESLLPGLK